MLTSRTAAASIPLALLASPALAQPPPAEYAPVQDPARPEATSPSEPAKVLPSHETPPRLDASLGKGVSLRAGDESFSVQARARIQLRGVFGYQDPDDDPLADDAQERGSAQFLVRRARLQLRGHALSSKLTYYIQLGFSASDMESDLRVPLRDAQINWAPLRDLEIKAGQMKVPFNRQRTTSSSALQLMDRALANNELNLDRDVGVQLHSADFLGLGGRLGYQLSLTGGDGRNRTVDNAGMLYVARVVISPFGPVLDSAEADISRSDTPRVAIGLAAGFNDNTRRAQSTMGATFAQQATDYRHASADLTVRFRGASLNAEWLWREAEEVVRVDPTDPLSDIITRNGYGYTVQGGYLVTDEVELVARWSALSGIGPTAVLDGFETGAGVSWYLAKQAVKLQTDYLRLEGPAHDAGRHQVRVQAQIYF